MIRYEVDLSMIQKSVPEADGSHLDEFCNNLESIMDCENLSIVPTFHAANNRHNMVLIAFGWPTEEEWSLAIEKTFGLRVLHRSPRKNQHVSI